MHCRTLKNQVLAKSANSDGEIGEPARLQVTDAAAAAAADAAAAASSASSSPLQEGEHTAWDLPSTLRVPIRERARCFPHMKHDMVAAPNDVVAAKGEPETLDL
jgi:hypothetical protein